MADEKSGEKSDLEKEIEEKQAEADAKKQEAREKGEVTAGDLLGGPEGIVRNLAKEGDEASEGSLLKAVTNAPGAIGDAIGGFTGGGEKSEEKPGEKPDSSPLPDLGKFLGNSGEKGEDKKDALPDPLEMVKGFLPGAEASKAENKEKVAPEPEVEKAKTPGLK